MTTEGPTPSGGKPSHRTVFNGPAGVQTGPGSVQHNHFYAAVRRALPWGKIKDAFLTGLACLLLAAPFAGGAWWVYHKHQADARSAARSASIVTACQQAAGALLRTTTDQIDTNPSTRIGGYRAMAHLLEGAAGATSDPTLATQLRAEASDDSGYADALQNNDQNSLTTYRDQEQNDASAWEYTCRAKAGLSIIDSR